MLGAADAPVETVLAVIASAGAAAVAVWRGLIFGLRLRDRVNALVEKVETMWAAQLRRGRVEGERAGLLIPEHPQRISPEAWDRFGPIRDDLRALYRSRPGWSENDLTLAIEKAHGEWIVENICRPFAIHELSCLLAAAIVARQPNGNGQPGSRQVFAPGA